jgi:hypothetical protein
VSLRVRRLLASLDSQHDLAHDLEFLPINPRPILADEGLVSFLGRDQVTPVQWQEWDTLCEGVLPCKTVGKVAALGAHEDDQPHELLLRVGGDQIPGLVQAVDRGAVDGGNDGTQ